MSVHHFRIVQKIPIPVKQAWDFFSHPGNLQLITPPAFQFKILTNLGDRPIYTGQVIDYTVRPIFNIRMRWTTLITRVEEESLFIDEQTRGPYRYWKHEHYFRPVDGGTEMTDLLAYEVPGWVAGDILNALLIRSEIESLFDYRHKKIEERFSGRELQPLPGRDQGQIRTDFQS
jgi:ligand-binding SRPBCC domain-containing protein